MSSEEIASEEIKNLYEEHGLVFVGKAVYHKSEIDTDDLRTFLLLEAVSNPERLTERRVEYRRIVEVKNECEKTLKNRMKVQRRLARLRCLPDNFTEVEWEIATERFGGGCALTGSGFVHADHVIPLATGHGGTIYENIIPLRADLNISKSDRCIFDWFSENKERFNLSQTKFDELIEYLAEINGMTTKEYEEYVRWCHDNPRTLEDLQASNTKPDAS